MRILAPGFLYHQSLTEWATYGLEEKMSLKLAFDVFSAKIALKACLACV